MEQVRQVLAEELGLCFTYPSSDALVHSTRCLLYDNSNDGSDPKERPKAGTRPSLPFSCSREVVVKACPIGLESTVIKVLSKLYEECEILKVAKGEETSFSLYDHICIHKPRHPGLLPLLAVCQSQSPQNRLYVVSNFHPQTLQTLLHFNSQSVLEYSLLGRMSRDSVVDLRIYFLFYQLCRILGFYHHQKGLALGNLSMKSVYVTDMVWLRVMPSLTCQALLPPSSQALLSSSALPPSRPPGYDTPLTLRWLRGQVDNFEYLMAINAAAGRSMIDATFHSVLPWVSDLQVRNGGWRDLRKSKFRLRKGDEQLDSTYHHSNPPHHITESLSEITYYIYMARRTPLDVLRRIVREKFVPEHYPSHIDRMYSWSPDECIPEFFCDASVFTSLHRYKGMEDMAFPSWCGSASEFVSYHRGLLESEEVSRQLHHWIDLTFGHCLQGSAAVEHKNVPLLAGGGGNLLSPPTSSSSHRFLAQGKNPGFVQVFRDPHPKRSSLREGLEVLEQEDLQEEYFAAAAAASGCDSGGGAEDSTGGFMMAVEGVEVTGNEYEMLQRAPTIPLDNVTASHLHAGLESLEVVQVVGTFAHKAQRMLEPAYVLPPSATASSSPLPGLLQQQQADDMFAAGCILAELYLGQPVLSLGQEEGVDTDPMTWLPGEAANLPFRIRCLLKVLLQRDPVQRPRAIDLLAPGEYEEEGEEGEEGEDDSKEGGDERPNVQGMKELSQVAFPEYFRDMWSYLSMLYQPKADNFESISVTLSLTRQLVELPLPAFALVLPHMLQVLDDPAPYEEYERRAQELVAIKSNATTNDINMGGAGGVAEFHGGEAPVILRLNPFLDLVGQKLGIRQTQRVLFPRLASFLSRLTDRRLLRALLASPVWSILVQRGGTAGFLTHFLAFMLNMVGPKVPLEVQQAAYVAVFNLTSPDILGLGLVARYVLPSLLEGIGALEEEEEEQAGIDGSAAADAADAADAAASSWCEDLYQARVVINLCKEIGDDLFVSLVAERLLMEVLPTLKQYWMPEPSTTVSLTLLECFTVLEGILSTVQATSALFHYCQQPSLPVQQILLAIPLPPPPTTTTASPLIPHSPRHRLHIQLSRLVTALSISIGPSHTEEYLLPSIDAFLGSFNDLYGSEGDSTLGTIGTSLDLAGAEGGKEEGQTWRMAAFDMVSDMWQHLESIYDDATLRRLVPNGKNLVTPWHHELNGEGREKTRGNTTDARNSNDREQSKGGKDRSSVDRERLAGFVIEKGISWLNKGRKGFQRVAWTGEGLSTSSSARSPTAQSNVEIALNDVVPRGERNPGHALASHREESEESRGEGTQEEEEETEDLDFVDHHAEDDEGEEVDPNHGRRRVSTAGKGVLLPVSPSNALSLSPSRRQTRHKNQASDDEEDDMAEIFVGQKFSSALLFPSPRASPVAVSKSSQSSTISGPSLPFLRKKRGGKGSSSQPEGRSAQREAWSSQVLQKDHVWLVGPLVDPPTLPPATALQAVGCSWPIHMSVQTTLQAYKAGGAVRSLCVDPAETLLLTGSRRGVLKVWALREYPVLCQQIGGGGLEHHTESIFSLSFMNGSDHAVSLDGSLVVWDVNTGAVLTRREKYAPEIGGMPMSYMAVDVLPLWSVGVGDSSGGHQQHHQLLACTQSTLYHFDLRDRASSLPSSSSAAAGGGAASSVGASSATTLVASQASEWGVSSSCFQDRGIGGAIQCLTSHDDGYWVCVGSSNGQMCVLDRRSGEIAQAWQAHEAPIIRIFPWSRDKVLSVSLDRTAILWDIRSTIPRDICCLRGLPDSQSGSTVLTHEFARPKTSSPFAASSTSNKRPHLLMSFGGHKGVIAGMPRAGMEVMAKSRYFLSPDGLKLRTKIVVQSAALLPLRNLLLVGCDDGLVRVCR